MLDTELDLLPDLIAERAEFLFDDLSLWFANTI